MKLDLFRPDDIVSFLHLATSENWVAESWEFEFLLANFPQGCFVARLETGDPVGYVTALRHDHSGWIGNLIVAGDVRGQGIGEQLFVRALDALRSDGVETIWLTASKDGQKLYEKHGFKRIDTILRWVGSGRHNNAPHNMALSNGFQDMVVNDIDGLAWGDRRDALMSVTVNRGRILRNDAGFAVIQPCGDASQLGPFTALDSGTADRLLGEALWAVSAGSKLYLDSPVSNKAAQRMFTRNKLKIGGTTELMYVGRRPEYRPELLYGLATMGSCG